MSFPTGNCPGCGVPPGSEHRPDCDVEPCPNCGQQLVSCPCPRDVVGHRRLPWPGERPGDDLFWAFSGFPEFDPWF
jgi:hypothetical protein